MIEAGGQTVLDETDRLGPADRAFIPFAEADEGTSIATLFETVAVRFPNRRALQVGDRSITYENVARAVARLSTVLSQETAPGDLIGIYLPATEDFAIAVLACFASGRAFVPLDVHYPASWSEAVVEDAAPDLIVVRGALDGAPPALTGRRLIDLAASSPDVASGEPAPRVYGPDDPACVLYTSGSSGRPKGIVNSQRNLLRRVGQSINAARFNANDCFLSLASLCTVVGVRDLLTAWLCGACACLVDAQALGARDVLDLLSRERVTVLFGFPALLRTLMDLPPERQGHALRLIRIGGDTLLWSDVDRLRAWLPSGGAVQLIYAATEAPMMQWFVSDARRDGGERVPIGYPSPGNGVCILDEDGAPTLVGEVGEIVVRSPYVALGYWVDGACQPGAIAYDPSDAHNRIWRSGDLARVRADGFVDRLGRADRQVKVAGLRVEPEGVETILRSITGVLDAAVIPRMVSAGDRVSLIGYLVAAPDAPTDILERVTGGLREKAPPHMRPRALYLIDAIPRLPNSKPDVQALQRDDVARQSAVAPPTVDPSSDADPLASAVARAWEAALGRPPAGPDEDFFEGGGDSLQALNLVFTLERTLGLELEATIVNAAPTFGRLCEALRSHTAPSGRTLVLLKGGDRTGSLFIVPSVGGNVLELAALARRMTWPGLVWGLPARGLDGRADPHPTIEAMADHHLKAIKARQPEGPYSLCGYSFGGLVAFEMARRLAAAGETVAFLGMFDTVPNIRRWPLKAWLSYAGLRVARRGAALVTMPIRDWPAYVGEQAGRAWRHAMWRVRPSGGVSPIQPALPHDSPPHYGQVMAAAIKASANYRLRPYKGVLTLFRPMGRDPDFARAEAIWWRYVHDVRLHVLPGTHGSLLREPHVTAAAEALSRCLPGPLPQAPAGLTVRR